MQRSVKRTIKGAAMNYSERPTVFRRPWIIQEAVWTHFDITLNNHCIMTMGWFRPRADHPLVILISNVWQIFPYPFFQSPADIVAARKSDTTGRLDWKPNLLRYRAWFCITFSCISLSAARRDKAVWLFFGLALNFIMCSYARRALAASSCA